MKSRADPIGSSQKGDRPETVEVDSDDSEHLLESGARPGSRPRERRPIANHRLKANESSSNIAVAKRLGLCPRRCAVCHGERLVRESLRETLSSKPSTTRHFLSLCSDQVPARRYVITGETRPQYAWLSWMRAPGSPQFQPLTDEEIAVLVAIMASWRERDVTSGQIAEVK